MHGSLVFRSTLLPFLSLTLTVSALVSHGVAADTAWQPLGLTGNGGMFSPAISPVDPKLMMLNCDMSGAYLIQGWRRALADDPSQPTPLEYPLPAGLPSAPTPDHLRRRRAGPG